MTNSQNPLPLHAITTDSSGEISSVAKAEWWQGWLPLFVLPVSALLIIPSTRPRWVVMWALSFAIYGGFKWVTWRRSPFPAAPLWRHAAYLFAWPGMDAKAFMNVHSKASLPTMREWWFALFKFVAGLLIFFQLAGWIPLTYPYLVGWVGMIGLVMLLHFGAIHLVSCAWRYLGVNARPIMNRPLASTSLSEFWGKRWNTAFRDLTYRFLFRPLTAWWGPRTGILVGFAISGLIHDAVISVSAQGGYGGPTVYFLVQGGGLMLERSRLGRNLGLMSSWQGRLFAAAILITPVMLLFHRPFVVNVILPFMHAVGAIK